MSYSQCPSAISPQNKAHNNFAIAPKFITRNSKSAINILPHKRDEVLSQKSKIKNLKFFLTFRQPTAFNHFTNEGIKKRDNILICFSQSIA